MTVELELRGDGHAFAIWVTLTEFGVFELGSPDEVLLTDMGRRLAAAVGIDPDAYEAPALIAKQWETLRRLAREHPDVREKMRYILEQAGG